MTTTFTVSKNFHKELKRINDGIQSIVASHNLFFLEAEFNRLVGYINGLQQVMYTDEIDLYEIFNEVVEIYKVRKREIEKAGVDEHVKYFGNVNIPTVCVVMEK